MPILLKNIVKSILREAPEYYEGESWNDPTCVGPFIMFTDKYGEHYIFGNRREGVSYIDGNPVGNGKVDTHGALIARYNSISDDDDVVELQGHKKNIHGRIWKPFFNGEYVISTWNSRSQLDSFGMKTFMMILSDLLKTHLNGNIKQVKFNPYSEGNDFQGSDNTYSYDEMINSNDSNGESTEHQDRNKELHMMSPNEKNRAMKDMGIKPKSVTTPDFMKRQAAGVDENL